MHCCVLGWACNSGPAGPLPTHLWDKAKRGDGEEGPERQTVWTGGLPGTRTNQQLLFLWPYFISSRFPGQISQRLEKAPALACWCVERSLSGFITSAICPLCFIFNFIFLSVSGVSSSDCWMIIWVLGRCVLSCFPPTPSPPACLTLRLFPLSCFLPSAPRCLICASPSCCCASADNTGGGSGGPGLPGNSLTDHMAAVTCCILSRSACSPLCALWGDTFSAGSSHVHRCSIMWNQGK